MIPAPLRLPASPLGRAALGGAVETINPAKYIHSVIDSALERLMLEPSAPGKPPLARPMKKPRVEKK